MSFCCCCDVDTTAQTPLLREQGRQDQAREMRILEIQTREDANESFISCPSQRIPECPAIDFIEIFTGTFTQKSGIYPIQLADGCPKRPFAKLALAIMRIWKQTNFKISAMAHHSHKIQPFAITIKMRQGHCILESDALTPQENQKLLHVDPKDQQIAFIVAMSVVVQETGLFPVSFPDQADNPKEEALEDLALELMEAWKQSGWKIRV